ncbi:MAG TPA: hypothetical protein VHF46_06320 [Rubrobacteraceae bacterium]|nr:hypothetical protein [Rubrobacteraceae bacterium]
MTSRVARATSASLLRRNFRASFTAHAHGILATEFILVGKDREEFGRLRLGGTYEAKFDSKDHVAVLEASGTGYRLVLDGEEVRAIDKRLSGNELKIFCADRTYKAQVSLFRSLAVASYPGGKKVVSLSGGLVGRSYEVLFDAEDACAFSVAIFLLWYITMNRRRAYRTRRGIM